MILRDPAGPAADTILSVSEFTRRVKTLLERGLAPGWVRGEISNLRAQSSGHIYFSLKDAGAQVAAVLFRTDALRQTAPLRDGLQVIAFGEIGVYEARGQYQLVVRMVIEDGLGRLQREFEALKLRLAAEGLFAAERKKPIPAMPRVVGFITSPTGAALQDFLRILLRRGWSGRVIVIGAKVQGAGAALELAAGLKLAAEWGGFDLLVIGRGGGSLEDLWAFNEELLVRAIAACPVPVISAVGHEIDFTLCDFVADARAETPSAAAELISSRFVNAVERERRVRAYLTTIAAGRLAAMAERLDHARSRLRLLTPSAQIEQGYLRLDDIGNRLRAATAASWQRRRETTTRLAARFERMHPGRRIERDSHALLSLWKRLQAASPASVLNRGFVIMRDAAGQPLLRGAEIAPGQPLRAEFADGIVDVHAD